MTFTIFSATDGCSQLHHVQPAEAAVYNELQELLNTQHGGALAKLEWDEDGELIGVWAEFGAGGLDLIGAGHSVFAALADALATARGWR